MSFPQNIIDYFRSSKAELEKVAWPSRQDTIRYSTLVIAVSVIVASFFALLDLGLSTTVDALLARKTPVAAPTTATQQPTPDNPSAGQINQQPAGQIPAAAPIDLNAPLPPPAPKN